MMGSGALSRLSRANLPELILVAEAQLVLLRCQLQKMLRPVGSLVRADQEPEQPGDSSRVREASEIGWAVTRAARFGVFRPQCLVRSLAIQRMLRRRGIVGSELRIGIRLEKKGMVAHAWVELCGAVIGDSTQNVSTFTPAPNLRMVQL